VPNNVQGTAFANKLLSYVLATQITILRIAVQTNRNINKYFSKIINFYIKL